MKPPFKLGGAYDTMFSIIFGVRDKLREAGLDKRVNEFLTKAVTCCSCGERSPWRSAGRHPASRII
jgi:hypothetical protein